MSRDAFSGRTDPDQLAERLDRERREGSQAVRCVRCGVELTPADPVVTTLGARCVACFVGRGAR